MDSYEAMGFDDTQLNQDEEQCLFTIETNMPLPMVVYGNFFQWVKSAVAMEIEGTSQEGIVELEI
jgi:hypothetical protein